MGLSPTPRGVQPDASRLHLRMHPPSEIPPERPPVHSSSALPWIGSQTKTPVAPLRPDHATCVAADRHHAGKACPINPGTTASGIATDRACMEGLPNSPTLPSPALYNANANRPNHRLYRVHHRPSPRAADPFDHFRSLREPGQSHSPYRWGIQLSVASCPLKCIHCLWCGVIICSY
jgi:hypothetical protein